MNELLEWIEYIEEAADSRQQRKVRHEEYYAGVGRMASPTPQNVHLEAMEAAEDKSKEPYKAGNGAVESIQKRQFQQRLLGCGRQWYSHQNDNERETRTSRILFLIRQVRVPALMRLNRRVPIGTHGGVRGRRLIAASYSIKYIPIICKNELSVS